MGAIIDQMVTVRAKAISQGWRVTRFKLTSEAIEQLKDELQELRAPWQNHPRPEYITQIFGADIVLPCGRKSTQQCWRCWAIERCYALDGRSPY